VGRTSDGVVCTPSCIDCTPGADRTRSRGAWAWIEVVDHKRTHCGDVANYWAWAWAWAGTRAWECAVVVGGTGGADGTGGAATTRRVAARGAYATDASRAIASERYTMHVLSYDIRTDDVSAMQRRPRVLAHRRAVSSQSERDGHSVRLLWVLTVVWRMWRTPQVPWNCVRQRMFVLQGVRSLCDAMWTRWECVPRACRSRSSRGGWRR